MFLSSKYGPWKRAVLVTAIKLILINELWLAKAKLLTFQEHLTAAIKAWKNK